MDSIYARLVKMSSFDSIEIGERGIMIKVWRIILLRICFFHGQSIYLNETINKEIKRQILLENWIKNNKLNILI